MPAAGEGIGELKTPRGLIPPPAPRYSEDVMHTVVDENGNRVGVPDMDEFHLIVNRIKAFKWHVVLHFDAIDLVTHEKLLDGLPVPYIIDHMGRVPTKDGLDQQPFKILLEFAKRDNCWIKVCGAERISSNGPPFTDAMPFAKSLIQLAPDRVLWGTDWPHPNIKEHMPNDGDLVDLIPLMAATPELQQKLLVDNPHRLYGFSN
jgi:predicted TIM-barrel fold metal-dependent hydrolase